MCALYVWSQRRITGNVPSDPLMSQIANCECEPDEKCGGDFSHDF
jgi:hypothetical protein